MNIVYSSSDAYAVCTGVSLYSLLENNKNEETIITYVLSTDISEKNKDFLTEISLFFNREIKIIDANSDFEKAANDFNLTPIRGSFNCYSRILLNTWFSDLDRVIVVDSDTMVCGPLAGAWNIDIAGKYFALTPEIAAYCKYNDTEDRKLIDELDIYYNTGICVANLKQWRDDNADEYLKKLIFKEKTVFKVADQSIINKYFNEKIVRLPLKFNYYSPVHNVSPSIIDRVFERKVVFDKEEILSAAINPIIIHYFGHSYERPWFQHSVALQKSRYLFYRSQTPWKSFPLDKWRKTEGFILKIYDIICYCLLKAHLYSLCLRFRYVWGQKIKQIIKIHR